MIKIGHDKVEDLFEIQQGICIATTKQDVNTYDFDFRSYFEVTSVIGTKKSNLILRIGAIHDYVSVYSFFIESGLKLINSIEEHQLVSLLPNWHERISALTPRSMVYETLPSAAQIEQDFDYPIFLKGERQTHKHLKSLCIAENKDELKYILDQWKEDPILHWQRLIVRAFIKLQPIEITRPGELQKSFEIRVFVWFGNILSIGQYWESEYKIELSKNDETSIRALTEIIYSKISVPFMVIDFGKILNNDWIVVELNDAQESGYALNSKMQLWSKLKEFDIL
jgi:hypothetical protein